MGMGISMGIELKKLNILHSSLIAEVANRKVGFCLFVWLFWCLAVLAVRLGALLMLV